MFRTRVSWTVQVWNAGNIAPAAGAEFSGHESHERKPQPLAKAKGLQKLPLGVVKGGFDGVDRRKWQARTSVFVEWGARYCNRARGSNEF